MIRCSLCPAETDGYGYTFGEWRTVSLKSGGKPYHICPAHWPAKDQRPEVWTRAYEEIFAAVAELERAPAAAVNP